MILAADVYRNEIDCLEFRTVDAKEVSLTIISFETSILPVLSGRTSSKLDSTVTEATAFALNPLHPLWSIDY